LQDRRGVGFDEHAQISSAIVNQAPSVNACKAYHLIRNKWHPVPKTTEELVEMFERRPENGEHVRFRKILPNRNWTFWEECGSGGSMGATAVQDQEYDEDREHHHHHPQARKTAPKTAESHNALDWYRDHYGFDRKHGSPSTISSTSSPEGKGEGGPPIHEHGHGLFCHQYVVSLAVNWPQGRLQS
jgi:hypothetical protein